MTAATGWVIGIGFFAAAVVFALRKQWWFGLAYIAISVIAFSTLYHDGSFSILLEAMSLSLILIPGICLLAKRGQLVAVKNGLIRGTRELGMFLILVAIIGAVGIIMSALG